MSTTELTIRARAPSNIALVKYWGKRPSLKTRLNLPAVGSISVSLADLWSETDCHIDSALAADEVRVDGEAAPSPFAQRVRLHLDLLREAARRPTAYLQVNTRNNFPTAAGLASSASGFAALTLAACSALDLTRPPEWTDGRWQQRLSQWARMGSGSAARSVYGGYVELYRGEDDDGEDCFAEPLAPRSHWPLVMVIAVSDTREKAVGSTVGMQRCAETSPYYPAWLASHAGDLDTARRAIGERDFSALAAVVEHSCMKMHASMMAAQPALTYLRGATIEAMHRVVDLRQQGTAVCYTADAGPQLKALCQPEAVAQVEATLADVPGISAVLTTPLADGPQIGPVP